MSIGSGAAIILLNLPGSSSTTWLPFSSSASASSFDINLPMILEGSLNAASNGSTRTCVMIVETVL